MTARIKFFLIFFLLICGDKSSWGEEHSSVKGTGIALYAQGDPFVALKKAYYKSNNAAAAFELGYLYGHKSWVAQNAFNAFSTFKGGSAYAKSRREKLLHAVTANSDHSLAWYERAAEAGHSDALLRRGDLYGLGSFSYSGYTDLAIDFYKKAAAKKNPEAMYRLGSIFANDDKAQEGKKTCFGGWTGWYSHAQRESLRWYEAAFKAGHTGAGVKLGDIFRFGELGHQVDLPKALGFYRQSAEKKDVNALFRLGELYASATPPDTIQAAQFYIGSAKRGHPQAHQKLQELNLIEGFHQRHIHSYFQELMSFLKEKKADSGQLQYIRGILYEYGIGVLHDQEKALTAYQRAAQQNFPQALYKIGWIYEHGLFHQAPNKEAALGFYFEAMHHQDPQAHFKIGELYADRTNGAIQAERCYKVEPLSMVVSLSLGWFVFRGALLMIKRFAHNPHLDIQPHDMGVHNVWHPNAF